MTQIQSLHRQINWTRLKLQQAWDLFQYSESDLRTEIAIYALCALERHQAFLKQEYREAVEGNQKWMGI